MKVAFCAAGLTLSALSGNSSAVAQTIVRLTFPDGYTYTGEAVNGIPNGQGTATWLVRYMLADSVMVRRAAEAHIHSRVVKCSSVNIAMGNPMATAPTNHLTEKALLANLSMDRGSD